MAHAARRSLLPRPGKIRSRALEGGPDSLRKDSPVCVFPIWRRTEGLRRRIVRYDGSHTLACHDSAEIPTRACSGSSHRSSCVGYAAAQTWHPYDGEASRSCHSAVQCSSVNVGASGLMLLYDRNKLRRMKPTLEIGRAHV